MGAVADSAASVIQAAAAKDRAGPSGRKVQNNSGLPSLYQAGQNAAAIREEQLAGPDRQFDGAVSAQIVRHVRGRTAVILADRFKGFVLESGGVSRIFDQVYVVWTEKPCVGRNVNWACRWLANIVSRRVYT